MKKILPLLLVLLLLCGCSEKVKLDGGRWYIDDINNTVRTVVSFDKKADKLYVNYILIDEGRAERTGVDGLQYVFDEYFYRDYGSKIPEEYAADASDKMAFAVYHTREDFEADENGMLTFYHFEKNNLVADGNICNTVTKEQAKEFDEIIAENKAAIGE